MNPDLKVQLLQSFGVPLEKLKELGIVVKDSSGNLTVKGTHIEPLALTPFSRGDTMPHPASSDSRCAMTAEPRPPVTPQPSDNTNDDGAMPVRNSSSLGQTNSQTPGMRKPWMMPSGGNPAAASNSGASSSRLHPASASATSTTMVSQNHGDLPLDLRRLQSMIQQLYSLCDGWISKNASEYMPERDQETLASNDALVQYLCRLTYPSNRQHALSHLVTIMSNKMGRDNLLLRMFTEFFVNRVWPVTEWLNMKPSPLSLKLKAVFQKLHRTGKCFPII